jgi:zinc protease
MGHIDGPDAMALAWMHSAGVNQMIGYTVPTWFGYAGWGCLDYFVEQPGRYTFVEAFHANQRALVYNLQHEIGNRRGLEFDRDVVALYGDPAWAARMAEGPRAFEQTLTRNGDLFTLRITGNRGSKSFAPVNTNGSQRGGRPLIAFLPFRVTDVRVLVEGGLNPLITDDFVLIPHPGDYEEGREYEVTFRATRVEDP